MLQGCADDYPIGQWETRAVCRSAVTERTQLSRRSIRSRADAIRSPPGSSRCFFEARAVVTNTITMRMRAGVPATIIWKDADNNPSIIPTTMPTVQATKRTVRTRRQVPLLMILIMLQRDRISAAFTVNSSSR